MVNLLQFKRGHLQLYTRLHASRPLSALRRVVCDDPFHEVCPFLLLFALQPLKSRLFHIAKDVHRLVVILVAGPAVLLHQVPNLVEQISALIPMLDCVVVVSDAVPFEVNWASGKLCSTSGATLSDDVVPISVRLRSKGAIS